MRLARGRHQLLLFILIGFLLLGVTYNRLIPPFEGPDEAQHFAYVVWLAENGTQPPQGEAAWSTDLKQEASQPPFYYFVASLPMRLANLTTPEAVYRPNPHYPAPLPHPIPDNENRAIQYTADTRPLQGQWLGFYLARGVTQFFGLILIAAVYALGRQVTPTEPAVALGAAFLAAMSPQVIYLSTMVSNDVPAAALSTLALWLLAVLLRRDRTRPFRLLSLAAGAVLGLAGLTKVSALGLGLPFLFGLIWMWRSGRWPIRRALEVGWWIGVGTTAVAAWWFLHNWLRYGAPIALDTHEYAPWSLSNEGVLAGIGARWLEVVRSYWLALGWGALRPGDWAYAFLFALGLAALIGLILFFVRLRQPQQQPDALKPALLGILSLSVLVIMLLLELWMRRVVAVHGRLLFPALGAIFILLMVGWRSWHKKLPWAAYIYTLTWTLLVPMALLRPAYTPAFLSEPVFAALPGDLGWQILEEGHPLLEIKQVNLPQATAVAGALIPVEICWRALAETNTDYSFLVQVIGPENRLISSRRTYPGHGLIPTSDWAAGAAACETTNLLIPDDLPATLLYQVEVAFIDHATERRLAMVNEAGLPLSPAFAAPIRLAATNTVYANELSGEPFDLLSYDANPTWIRGEATAVRLSWAASATPATDYQIFLHLRNADGQTIAQADGPPLAGWYPTSWWTPGEIVTDERTFFVSDDVPPGQYTLVTGLYDLETGERPVGEHLLGQIEVKSPGENGA